MQTTKSFSQNNIFLPVTKLEIKDGLPGINVRKITKDKFGFMWFATQDGISRFDGRSFINLNSYKVDSKRKILGTDFYDIQPDITGNYLWALSSYGGLNKIDLTTCNVVVNYRIKQAAKGDTTLWYKRFVEKQQSIIIGTDKGLISNFNKATGITEYSFSLKKRFACVGDLQCIMIDNNSRVWFFMDDKILVTDSLLKTKIALIEVNKLHEKLFTITDYAVYLHYVFVTTTKGLKIIDINTLIFTSTLDKSFSYLGFFTNRELQCISVDGQKAIISGNDLLCKINLVSKEVQTIKFAGDYEDQSWITLTNSIYLDKNKIWLGSQYGVGWIKNTNSPFVPYFNSFDGQNIKIKHAITLFAPSNSRVLACGDDDLYSINPKTSVIRRFGLKDYYYSVFPVNRGYFIASGVSNGLQLFNNNFIPVDVLQAYPELAPIKRDTIMSSARLGDSIIFMASQNKNGLYIWNTRTKKIEIISTKTVGLSLKNDNINRLFVDSKNRLWIVCENVVSIYDYFTKTIKHLALSNPATAQPLSINMDVCEGKNGYWLACYGTGIVELSENLEIEKIYDEKHGLTNLGLYKVFSVNDSMVLCSSNNGLALINTKTGFIKTFTVEDGLQSNSFEEASGCTEGNFIFFGGINGVTKIDITRLIQQSFAPKVTFSTITFSTQDELSSDMLNLAEKQISIPNYVTQVTVNFSAINYPAPDKVKFAYRIAEKGKNWSFTNQNFIQSFRLAPGTYTLQVKAANEDGVWSSIKQLQLVFMPMWYQTWLFNVIIIIAVAAMLYALYRYRVKQILKVERIRQKLSSDLHDDIGSTLNSVSLFTKMAMIQPDKDEFLVQIKAGVQSAIESIRDIIWILDKEPETIESIFNRISAFSQPLAKAAGCIMQISIEPQLAQHSLHGQEKQNIYLVIKEAVNNCIKYAACTVVTIQATQQPNQLCIYVIDNGKGIDTADGKVKIAEGGSGHGLKNMRLRCAEIKWKLDIDSAPGKGTTIALTGKFKG